MALRAPFRKIVVSGRDFVWKLRDNSLYGPGDRHIVVCAPSRASHLLIDPYPWELEIVPATVASAIQFALSRGWDPLRRGPPMILGYKNGSFFVLPEGVRFTHDLAARQLAAVPLPDVASVRPSTERLAIAVTDFDPWLNARDVQDLSAAFSVILFEPGRYWDAFERGSITRTELRNALVARAQAFIGDCMRPPVPPEALEAVIVPAFDHLLFDGEPNEPADAAPTKSSDR